MTYAIIMVTAVYYYIFIYYYRELLTARKNRHVFVTFALLLFIFTYLFLGRARGSWIVLPAVLLLAAITLKFSVNVTWIQAFYGGITSTLSVYSFRGTFTTIGAMTLADNSFFFLHTGNTYHAISLIAFPTTLLFFHVIRKTLLPDQKMKVLLQNQRQLQMMIFFELTALILLTIISEGRYLSPHTLWFNSVFLGACLFTIGMLIFFTFYSVRATECLEYEWTNKMLEKQYRLQLRHYKSYERYTESFRSFRHDYRSMLTTLKTLIRNGKNEEAYRFMDGMYTDMYEKMQVHKKYSNHVILDAMLQDLANICEENKIRFTCTSAIPGKPSLPLIDAVRVFSNLSNNAVEACLKTDEQDRFIKITGSNKDGWTTLQFKNSFDGQLTVKNELPATTKDDTDNHGLGLAIVKKIIESAGGFLIIDADKTKKVFLVRVHIPHTAKDLESDK
ncbi:GHKL domain-containing protein [Clostridium sp. HBUAS56010]|uniref:sensor histidine kinase n=1 Tax=Clostridium sp. HBUAS56010 TaxID=2571127 RepID=UPI001177ED5D|nr:GHKL domain-containing protein [Clostridium sp. HBUAS56010]